MTGCRTRSATCRPWRVRRVTFQRRWRRPPSSTTGRSSTPTAPHARRCVAPMGRSTTPIPSSPGSSRRFCCARMTTATSASPPTTSSAPGTGHMGPASMSGPSESPILRPHSSTGPADTTRASSLRSTPMETAGSLRANSRSTPMQSRRSSPDASRPSLSRTRTSSVRCSRTAPPTGLSAVTGRSRTARFATPTTLD